MRDTNAVCVGGALSMSTAADYNISYKRDRIFVENYSMFEEKYRFHCIFDGFYHNYRTDKER